MRLVIDGKRRLGHWNGEVKPLESTDPNYKQWQSENTMVTACLINSMETAIGKPFMFLPTARDVWEAVQQKYSDLENCSQLYDLNTRMWRRRRVNRDVMSYYINC